jgi:hypothetical protein
VTARLGLLLAALALVAVNAAVVRNTAVSAHASRRRGRRAWRGEGAMTCIWNSSPSGKGLVVDYDS